MKHLLLLSKHVTTSVHNKITTVLWKEAKEIRLLFCDNAADIFRKEWNDLPFISLAKWELISLGYTFERLDLRERIDKTHKLVALLKDYDAVFFTGWMYHTLMTLFVVTWLNKQYAQVIDNDLLHIWFSAGACICSPFLQYYACFDPTTSQSEIPKHWLNLFPHYIFPHYSNKQKYTKYFESTLKTFGNEVLCIPLENHQAIYVKDSQREVI